MKLLALLWASALVSYAGAFIVPDQLVSLLTVIYSSIPPVRKGSDSRVGVGFRFGPFADFQVLLELGPQITTQPLTTIQSFSGKREVDEPFNGKRDVDPGKRPDIQVLEEPSADSRSARARARSIKVGGPTRANAFPAPARGDWLSRWRASFAPQQQNPWQQVAPSPIQDAVLVPQESAPRATRAPRFQPLPQHQPDGIRMDAVQTLRRLYWAGQQAG